LRDHANRAVPIVVTARIEEVAVREGGIRTPDTLSGMPVFKYTSRF
jgi:hypothetical protein